MYIIIMIGWVFVQLNYYAQSNDRGYPLNYQDVHIHVPVPNPKPWPLCITPLCSFMLHHKIKFDFYIYTPPHYITLYYNNTKTKCH